MTTSTTLVSPQANVAPRDYSRMPMGINNPPEYFCSIWNWNILEGCFGDSKRKPSDIDGVIEWRGHFLVIETKSPNAPLPFGQRRMYEWMVANGNTTVLVVWGRTNKPGAILVMSPSGNAYFPDATLDTLRLRCTHWYLAASANPRVLPSGVPHPYPAELSPKLPGNPPLLAQ